MLLTKLTEPEVRRAVLHGFTIPLDIQTVCLHPLVTAFESLLVLFSLVLPQHIHDLLRKFQRSLRLACFGGVGVNAFLRRVVACAADADDVVLEIHIFPL